MGRVALGSSVAALLVCMGGLAQAAPSPAVGRGTLALQVTTEGATVSIDGEKVGSSPLPAPLTLPAGDHTIKVERPGFAPFIDVFSITRRKTTRLEVELQPVAGVLHVTANIEKARVLVDGKFVGEVPLNTEIDVGSHTVKITKGGYKEITQPVAAVAGQESKLEVTLEELPEGINPYKPAPPPPPKWYEKKWVWAVGATSVVVVAAAVVGGVLYANRDLTSGSDYIFTIR